MPDSALKPALRAPLRRNEIGRGSPYRLYAAGKVKSGASFGFMQGDMAAEQAIVHETFQEALASTGVPLGAISSLAKRLSVPLIDDPSPEIDMCGRGNLLIRGESVADPGMASSGCIILAQPARESSGVDELAVVDRLE